VQPVPCGKCESEPAKKEEKKEDKQEDDTCFSWKKRPEPRIFPRPGYFPIPPTGPGYYSLQDQLRGECREKAPPSGYPAHTLMQPSFFDADFRYLEADDHCPVDVFEEMKRIHFADGWMFSTGGQISTRYMHEGNSRLTRTRNTYDLFRTRVYGDLWFWDAFRVYGEFIYADSIGHDLNPLPIDINRSDLLNLFVDVKLFELEGKSAYGRVGRQEILLGSQRLVSPLEWGNTRRTFEGVRAFRQGKKVDVDLFWLRPVLVDRNGFDSADGSQNFIGAWTTYRPKQGTFWDVYYLWLENNNDVVQLGIPRSPFNVHTLGTRYAGDKNNFLWDMEMALQLGRQGSDDIIAGMATLGGGYRLAKAPLTPTFWVYYDYASGDDKPGDGQRSTFNQLFAFGHYYLGWADQVGRQNIHDVSLHAHLYPAKWLSIWMQYHHFWLAAGSDALYNAAGVAIRRDATGRSGTNVGDEIDFVLNFHLGPHSDVLLGYSRLFGGGFLSATSGPTSAVNSDLFYAMYNFRW
jgi:hypothetical protein